MFLAKKYHFTIIPLFGCTVMFYLYHMYSKSGLDIKYVVLLGI